MRFPKGPTCMLVVFHHSEENTDRGEFSTFKGPLLFGFFIKSLPKKLKLIQYKKKKKKKKKCNQIHINFYMLHIFYYTSYLTFYL